MFARDWQPSTVTHAPRDPAGARRDARNATTSPTSSALPKRPNGRSRRTMSAMTSGIVLLPLPPRSALEHDRARRDAVDADVVLRELLRHRLGEADLGGLHGVVGHAAAGLAAPDRRDHQNHAAARAAHVRHGETRHADRGKQRLIERALPLGVERGDDVAAAGLADVVDEDVDAAETSRASASTTSSAPAVVETSASTASTASSRGAACRSSVAAASSSASAPRAQSTTRAPSSTSARADARPRPLLEPVTIAT